MKTARDKTYPYQNLSLKNIDGEHWLPAPGFEEYYEVSNLGRVKSIERISSYMLPSGLWVQRRVVSRMRKQSLVKLYNSSVHDFAFRLSVAFTVNGQQTNCVVARLVYMAFSKEQLDFKQDALWISHKDADALNNRFENLSPAERSVWSKNALQRGRIKPGLHAFVTKEGRHRQAQKLSSPVTQYDMHGRRIVTYDSVIQAAKVMGVEGTYISRAIQENGTSVGFIWKRGRGKALLKNIENIKLPNIVPVAQHTLDGRFITAFESISKASEVTGIDNSSISSACRSKAKTAGGFIWRKIEEK